MKVNIVNMWKTVEGTTSKFVLIIPKPNPFKVRVKYWVGVALKSV